MMQAGGDPYLRGKAARAGFVGQGGVKELDCNWPPQAHIGCAKDSAHRATTKLLLEPIPIRKRQLERAEGPDHRIFLASALARHCAECTVQPHTTHPARVRPA